MSKYSPEIKIKACEDYLSGKLSHKEICMKYGIHFYEKKCTSMLNAWLPRYLANGVSARKIKNLYKIYDFLSSTSGGYGVYW